MRPVRPEHSNADGIFITEIFFHVKLQHFSLQMSELFGPFFCAGDCMSASSSLNCFKPVTSLAPFTTLLSPNGMYVQ